MQPDDVVIWIRLPKAKADEALAKLETETWTPDKLNTVAELPNPILVWLGYMAQAALMEQHTLIE